MKLERFIDMTSTDTELDEAQMKELHAVVEKYPYFQAARALQLKGYYQNQDFSYHAALKKTAAFTTDRSVLFEYITSKEFRQHRISHQIKKRIADSQKTKEETQDFDRVIQMNREDADKVLDPDLFEKSTKIIASGVDQVEKPEITKDQPEEELKSLSEKEGSGAVNQSQLRSFSQWIKSTSVKQDSKKLKTSSLISKKSRSDEIIEKFMESNPKISPTSNKDKSQISIRDYQPDSDLMTETLAKIYADQKNYDKAIQAYRILILKNPEKSGLFADRIREMELNKENKNQ